LSRLQELLLLIDELLIEGREGLGRLGGSQRDREKNCREQNSASHIVS
jgi:hypothetical protein